MRLIDADALIDEVMERYCEDCNKRKGLKNGKWRIVYSVGDAPCRACGIDDMMDEMEGAPTIDAVPVVRCVDCCYFLEDKWNNWNDRDGTCCWLNGQGVMYSSFCSYGERRTDEAD